MYGARFVEMEIVEANFRCEQLREHIGQHDHIRLLQNLQFIDFRPRVIQQDRLLARRCLVRAQINSRFAEKRIILR